MQQIVRAVIIFATVIMQNIMITITVVMMTIVKIIAVTNTVSEHSVKFIPNTTSTNQESLKRQNDQTEKATNRNIT